METAISKPVHHKKAKEIPHKLLIYAGFLLAESQGFEPWVRLRTRHFECRTFDHSDNSPQRKKLYHINQFFAIRIAISFQFDFILIF